MPQQTGRVTVKADDLQLQSKPGASIQLGGIDRDYDMSDQGTGFHKEKYVPAIVKCTMMHTSDTDLEKLRKKKSINVQYICDSGPVYTVPQACTTSVGELANGEVEITFMGEPAKS